MASVGSTNPSSLSPDEAVRRVARAREVLVGEVHKVIVGQDEMKTAILIAAIEPTIGGVLVFGDRGTGKSTAVRALAALLPPMEVVAGCRYNCDPERSRLHRD